MQRKWLIVTYEDGTKWVQNLNGDGTGELEIPAGKRVLRIAVSDEGDNPITSALAKHLDPYESKAQFKSRRRPL